LVFSSSEEKIGEWSAYKLLEGYMGWGDSSLRSLPSAVFYVYAKRSISGGCAKPNIGDGGVEVRMAAEIF
jgi:hypothetical protein